MEPKQKAFFEKALINSENDRTTEFVEKMQYLAEKYEAIYLSQKQRNWLEATAGERYTWPIKKSEPMPEKEDRYPIFWANLTDDEKAEYQEHMRRYDPTEDRNGCST